MSIISETQQVKGQFKLISGHSMTPDRLWMPQLRPVASFFSSLRQLLTTLFSHWPHKPTSTRSGLLLQSRVNIFPLHSTGIMCLNASAVFKGSCNQFRKAYFNFFLSRVALGQTSLLEKFPNKDPWHRHIAYGFHLHQPIAWCSGSYNAFNG